MERRDFLIILSAVSLFPLIPGELTADTKKKEIYLTIDDGPKDSHDQILDVLGENKATFFMVGKLLENPHRFDLSCRTLDLGHEIGNHSYSHPRFSKISYDQARKEIERTHKLIDQAYRRCGRVNPNFFRFPYGDNGRTLAEPIEETPDENKPKGLADILESLNYRVFFWNIDSQDWKYYLPKRQITLDQIMGNVERTRDGNIVLVHDLPITAERVIPFFVSSKEYELKSLRDI